MNRFEIDYLQFSCDEIPEFLGQPILTEASPMPFYKLMERYECGGEVHMGNPNSNKRLVKMSGECCRHWNMTNFPGRMVFIQMTGGKVSRIDFAVTTCDVEPLILFQEAVENGEVKSKRFPPEETRIISGIDGKAQTIYLGSLKKRAKKGVFRAYDKGLERGLLEHFSRFELEVRRDAANVAARRWSHGANIGTLIRAVVDIPDAAWWKMIMGAKNVELKNYPREPKEDIVGARWHWLITQVAPALGKLLALEKKQNTSHYGHYLNAVDEAMMDALKPKPD